MNENKTQAPCYYLRTKAFYVKKAIGIAYLEANRFTEHYWCVKTMGPVGPDDRPAVPVECGTHRRCFKERELDV